MAHPEDLLERFLVGEAPCAPFTHADHVRVAWALLARSPLMEAGVTFSECLQQIAARAGAADRYHATITWAYLFLVQERRARTATSEWSAFAGANPDLLDWKDPIVRRYYTEARLGSADARRCFVMPDRCDPDRPDTDRGRPDHERKE